MKLEQIQTIQREVKKLKKRLLPLGEMVEGVFSRGGSGRTYDLSDDTEAALLMQELRELKKLL